MAILLADIGGTNARFRWLDKGKLSPVCDYECENFKDPMKLIDTFLEKHPQHLKGIVIAAAGPIQKGSIQWTNRPTWKLSQKTLQKKYNLKNVLIVNDVQAQGEGLKTLHNCDRACVLITPGTGLGGCFIIHNFVIPGEIGQVKKEDGSKIENLISGPGIVYLYHSFGGDKKIKSARQIDELRNKNKPAKQAYEVFYKKWGELSARLATVFYASGGVYLWGGLIPKNKKDKSTLLTAYKKTLPQALSKIHLHFVKDKNLSFKGLVSLSHREFDLS